MLTGAQSPLRSPLPIFLIVRLVGKVVPVGAVIVKALGTESFPARPTPVSAMPIEGRVASLVLMIAAAVSLEDPAQRSSIRLVIGPGLCRKSPG